MFAELVMFDGPRSAELVAALERANTERIEPLLFADPEIRADVVATYHLRQPGGGHAVLVLSKREASLDKVLRLTMDSELLPGEDIALLPGPSRVERYEVEMRNGGGPR